MLTTTTRLPEKPSLPLLIGLCPLVFLVHDGEEILTIADWQQRHSEQMIARLGSVLGEHVATSLMWSKPGFIAAVITLFFVISLICFRAIVSLKRDPSKPLPTLFILLAGLYINVFTHATQALVWFEGYTPGIATAALVVLPYTLYMFKRMLRTGLVEKRSIYGVVGAGPVILLLSGAMDIFNRS